LLRDQAGSLNDLAAQAVETLTDGIYAFGTHVENGKRIPFS
jgi:hypothetical protein